MTKREKKKLGKLLVTLAVLLAGALSASELGRTGHQAQEESFKERESSRIVEGDTIEDPGLAVRFLDVGQADSILISSGEEHFLVDAGNRADGEYLVEALEDYGVDSLAGVIFTHPHEDHIGGASDILTEIPVEMVYRESQGYEGSKVIEALLEAEEKEQILQTDPEPGDTCQVGEAQITFLGPVSYDEDNPNNNSVVFRLDYGEVSFVFTGDAEREEEGELIESGASLNCDVLKLGHHGSSNASSYVFLREAMPEAVVISCGYDNQYGHPHEETLSRIRDLGAELYRTDEMGTVAVYSDGDRLEFVKEPSVHSDEQ